MEQLSYPKMTIGKTLALTVWTFVSKVISLLFNMLSRFIIAICKSPQATILPFMVFRVVMYGCESWTIKKAEPQRIYAFELWCWRRLLRVPRTARRSNQHILKEISPEYSLERLMLTLTLQYFDHLR